LSINLLLLLLLLLLSHSCVNLLAPLLLPLSNPATGDPDRELILPLYLSFISLVGGGGGGGGERGMGRGRKISRRLRRRRRIIWNLFNARGEEEKEEEEEEEEVHRQD
jgi:hypothetical protein